MEGEIMIKAIITLEKMTCPSCLQKITETVRSMAGVNEDSVRGLFNSRKIITSFDGNSVAIEEIERAIVGLGYAVVGSTLKDETEE